MEKKVIQIAGMNCENCKRHVEEALKEIKGVKEATVSLENQNATIELVSPVEEEIIICAVEGAGYEVV